MNHTESLAHFQKAYSDYKWAHPTPEDYTPFSVDPHQPTGPVLFQELLDHPDVAEHNRLLEEDPRYLAFLVQKDVQLVRTEIAELRRMLDLLVRQLEVDPGDLAETSLGDFTSHGQYEIAQ